MPQISSSFYTDPLSLPSGTEYKSFGEFCETLTGSELIDLYIYNDVLRESNDFRELESCFEEKKLRAGSWYDKLSNGELSIKDVKDENIKFKSRLTSGGSKTVLAGALRNNVNVDLKSSIYTATLLFLFGIFGATDPMSKIFLCSLAPISVIIKISFVQEILRKRLYSLGRGSPEVFRTVLPGSWREVVMFEGGEGMEKVYGFREGGDESYGDSDEESSDEEE
ncbi:hypothetical protein TL16_g05188 [Triparma laevis f. inornata]|uniref:Uncharacterized protein n=1 Tax=Triparma laevis f. inornata TaxID=1714386 RepID=A0A9W7AFB4_9STRA|nr:hypothetical protein TL16_g05188 [Triparma laevis f. inornata]